MVRFSLTRNAISEFGSNRITFEVVGHTRHPFWLTLTVLVPTSTGPETRILRHCGLHSPMRLRSDTIAHTFSGGAAMSMLALRSSGTGTPFCSVHVKRVLLPEHSRRRYLIRTFTGRDERSGWGS